ncbi:TPA: hypothetical protein DD712_03170 [Candidatus Acetothermia bacterium]|nr:hypothetical protein [Candidatus Acetothermia bacterium]
MQGVAPTCFGGEIPPRYRGKGTDGKPKKGGGSSKPPVQPGSSAPLTQVKGALNTLTQFEEPGTHWKS